ncbi:MAG: hypothetical protein HYZ81_26610 [Nitrospinae bacterium]|nr:hypothetical protein [Nitrospinota bacterium]
MQASLPLGLRAHNNQGLFADHYLDNSERLQALEEWRQATGTEEAFQKIAHLYSEKAVHFNNRTNEPQTEHDFIRPVLNLLWREQRPGDCYPCLRTFLLPISPASRIMAEVIDHD